MKFSILGRNLEFNLRFAPKRGEVSNDLYIPLADRLHSLYKIDVGRWRKAHQTAIDSVRPRREALMDVYDDALLDTTVQAKLQTRTLNIINTPFFIYDSGKEPDLEKTEELQKTWFYELLTLIAEKKYYGYSLPVFFFDTDGLVTRIESIPRENLIPEYRAVLPDLYTEELYFLDEPQFQNNYILFDNKDLGLLLEVARYTIFKKQAVSHWSLHQQIFGMPFRYANTDSINQGVKDTINEQLRRMAVAAYAVFPKGTEVSFLQDGKTDPHKIYQEAIRTANSETSNRILGMPQSESDNGSFAREQVNYQVSADITKADLRTIEGDVNDKVLPLLSRWGYNFEGYTFGFDQSRDLPRGTTQIDVDSILLQYFDIPTDYFLEKYGVPVLPKKQ